MYTKHFLVMEEEVERKGRAVGNGGRRLSFRPFPSIALLIKKKSPTFLSLPLFLVFLFSHTSFSRFFQDLIPWRVQRRAGIFMTYTPRSMRETGEGNIQSEEDGNKLRRVKERDSLVPILSSPRSHD